MPAADPEELNVVLAELAEGPVASGAARRPLVRGLLFEAAGELDAAHAAYELAAEELDPLADAALFALEGNVGNPDAALRLLPSPHDPDDPDDAPGLVHAINRGIWEWRRGHLPRARELLLEVDAAGRSALGRAVEESLDAARPGHGARLVSPLLTLVGDRCVANAAGAPVAAARRYLQRALALEPGHAAAAMQLARLHAEGGELADARQVLRGLLTRYPGWSEALALALHLGGGAAP